MSEIPYSIENSEKVGNLERVFLLLRALAIPVVAAFALSAGLAILVNLAIAPPTFRRDLTIKESVPPRLARVDGLVNPPDFPYGFYDPQPAQDGTLVRWTKERAAVTFPYLGNEARHAEVSIFMAGMRPQGQPHATVTLRLNGQKVSNFTAKNAFRVYTYKLDTFKVPNPYLYPSDVLVDIESTTVPGTDGKEQHGVAVGWVEVKLERARTDILIEAFLWGVGVALVLVLAWTRINRRWGAIYGGLALFTFLILHLTYLPRAISPAVEVGLAGFAYVWAVLLAPKERPYVGLLMAAAGLWVVIGGRLLVDWEVDDAYISYRYSWNLIHGYGLVYNPGEVVEGYTNFLWTLLSAGAMRIGLPPGGFALAATIVCGICLVGITNHLGRRLAGGHRRAAGGLALAVSALTRPEGLLVAVLILAARAWHDRQAGLPTIRLLLAALAPFLVIMVPYEAWRLSYYGYPFPNTFYAKTGTSIDQFGRGALYALRFLSYHWLLVALALVGIAFAVGQVWKSIRRPKAEGEEKVEEEARANLRAILSLFAVVYTLYIIAEGGDWAIGSRFFVPLAAPVALLAQEGARLGLDKMRADARYARGALAATALAFALYDAYALWNGLVEGPAIAVGLLLLALAYVVGVWRRRLSHFSVAAAALVMLIVVSAIYDLWVQRLDAELSTRTMRDMYKFQKWCLAALWVRDNTPPNTLLSATPAGSLAFYSERPVIDMFGLNDLHIGHLAVSNMGSGLAGHEKRDAVYVFNRKPDYMMLSDKWYFLSMEDQFNKDYEPFTIRTASGYEIGMLRRKNAPR